MQCVKICGLEECKVAKNQTPCVVADLIERRQNEQHTDFKKAVLGSFGISSS